MTSYELVVLEADDPSIAVMDVSGELDLTNARELEERLDDLSAGKQGLVLELNKVSFIDSAALHVLFKVAQRRPKDRLVLLMEPTAPVSRTLDIVRMRDAVGIVASLDELERSG